MNEHILNECPETEINCSFIGCDKKMKRKQLEDHFQNDWKYHLQQNNLMIKSLSEQLKQVKEQVDNLSKRHSTFRMHN